MTSINVLGARLEVRHIAAPDPAATPLAPIVFLHEGLGSVAQWQGKGGYWPEQVCAATGRAGLVVSRRGYGQSESVPDVRGAGRLPPDYMHREAFEVLPALLAATGITRPVLLGHSDGGTIALLHASRFPVEACIVMAPHVMVEDVSIRAIEQARDAYLATASDPKGLRARLARHHADVDCAFWQWNDVWLSDAFRSFDIRPDCAAITAPVLAIQGWDDGYGTMAQIDSIKAAKPTPAGAVVLQKLEQCGHAPQKDQPQRSLGLVRDFLAAQA
jgi:pimeloyl-ACP methyl ester carboxylesterase